MNKGSLNTILYALITVLIVFLIFKALPYAIVAGLVIWCTVKIYRFLKDKFGGERKDNGFTYSESEVHTEDDDFNTSEAIDVDYKDAD